MAGIVCIFVVGNQLLEYVYKSFALKSLKDSAVMHIMYMYTDPWESKDMHVINSLYSITVMSHVCHRVSNHQQLNGLFNSLFRLTNEENMKNLFTGILWRESTGD